MVADWIGYSSSTQSTCQICGHTFDSVTAKYLRGAKRSASLSLANTYHLILSPNIFGAVQIAIVKWKLLYGGSNPLVFRNVFNANLLSDLSSLGCGLQFL